MNRASAGSSSVGGVRLTMVGHSTVQVELDGVTLLTDPLLRDRVLLLRAARPPGYRPPRLAPDAVLLSHFHRDHYDPRSLQLFDRSVPVVGPPGTRARLAKRGFANAVELEPGETTTVGGVTVRATPAVHGPGAALGFLLAGSARLYFAGDTDLFPEMAELGAEGLDAALLPIGGWGLRVPEGHLDPPRAAEALRLLRPRIAVPMHYGVLRPLGARGFVDRRVGTPEVAFTQLAHEIAPDVDVRVLEPGESLEVEGRSGEGAAQEGSAGAGVASGGSDTPATG